ncbi:nuclear transport factor 2 family protein [Streptomyces albidoflavus]|uniref:nuclear transport factor 2 family protein n=1 Tax=Streptomyces albidoflavus TaxID=1886 RepID=UPI0033324BBC
MDISDYAREMTARCPYLAPFLQQGPATPVRGRRARRASEEVRAHIWGPWKSSADGRDDTGRTVAPQQLAIGEWTRHGLTPTTPAPWSTTTTDVWHRDYANEPVRLSITARSKGSEWTVPLEVPVTIETGS